MIAIESPVPLPAPDFSLNASASSLSVVAGNSVGNQINLTVSNFSGTVTFGYSVAPASPITVGFSPASLTTNGSTAITLAVPVNTAPGLYVVSVTGTSTNPPSRSTTFIINVAAATSPQSIVFGSSQSLAGSVPASLDSLTNWRYEFRLHDFTANLPTGTARLVALGGTTLSTSYFYNPYANPIMYQLNLWAGTYNSLSAFLYGTANDLFVRVQRSGSDLTLNVWQIGADGSFTTVANSSTTWYAAGAATLTPGFSLGAGTDAGLSGGRMAFFRFYDSAVVNTSTPSPCDSSSALLRYEFNSNLTNTGTATAATLTNLGGPVYQPTPGDSCSLGGGTPSFQIVAGAQSPSSIAQGASATYPVTINRQNYIGTVNLTGCSGPAGVSCTAQSTSGNSAQVTLNTTSGTPVGVHTVTLNATGTAIPGATANLSLTVNAPTSGSLSLTTPTPPADVRPGYSTSTNFSIISTGITGVVNVGCVASVGPICTPTAVNVVPGSNNVTLQINVPANAAGATYSLTINANSTATGQIVTAPAVTTTLNVVSCYLSNSNSAVLPLNPGAPINLAMLCAPAAAAGDTITWQLLNASNQVLNSGVSAGAPNTRQFTAPANGSTGVQYYTARATYNLSSIRTADFSLSVNPIQGLTIYPQSNPPYIVNPGGQLTFGIIATGPVSCSVAQGTLTDSPPPGYAYGYIYTVPTSVGQLSLSISCFLLSNSAIRDSFPFLVNDALSVPPSVTSITWSGTGNTSSFQSIVVQGTYPLSTALPQSVSLLVSPSADNFAQANSCWSEAYGILYGNPSFASWRLWDNSGAVRSYDQGLLSYYLYPIYYNIYYRQNSQCQANYATIQNMAQFNYGPADINATSSTVTATHGIRFLAPYIGTHSVWGQITLYNGLQSAWTPPPVAPKQLVVQ